MRSDPAKNRSSEFHLGYSKIMRDNPLGMHPKTARVSRAMSQAELFLLVVSLLRKFWLFAIVVTSNNQNTMNGSRACFTLE